MISNKIKEIIAKQLAIDVTTITPNTTFADVNADSLDVVEVLMAIEKEFNIIIPDEDVDNLNTVSDLEVYIQSKMK